MTKKIHTAIKVFQKQNGIARSAQIFKLGVQPRTLYQMRNEGLVVSEGRGLYRLANSQPSATRTLRLSPCKSQRE